MQVQEGAINARVSGSGHGVGCVVGVVGVLAGMQVDTQLAPQQVGVGLWPTILRKLALRRR